MSEWYEDYWHSPTGVNDMNRLGERINGRYDDYTKSPFYRTMKDLIDGLNNILNREVDKEE